MSDIARRVIKVTPDQVIGSPRKRRERKPKGDPMQAANWTTGPGHVWITPETMPTQQGFGHFDRIAREMKR